MPRDSSGDYTLPSGNPVAPGELIESNWANSTLEDVALALTQSLSRTGQGGMLVPFLNADGLKTTPGISWANEPTSGWYRVGPGEFFYAVNGQDIFGINANGVTLAPGLDAEGFAKAVEQNDNVPPNYQKGNLWFDSDSGNLYLRYENPDQSFTTVGTNFVGIPSGGYLPLSGGTLTGPLTVPAGATGSQVPRKSEVDAAIAASGVPAGSIIDFAGNTPPAGYLICNGSAVSRTTYADLFAAIGATWGAGDTTTTFNIPNLNGFVTCGYQGDLGVVGNNVGNKGGAATHTLLEVEMPFHVHNAASGAGFLSSLLSGQLSGPGTQNYSVEESTNGRGGNGPHNNVQPTAVVLKIIKT